MSEDQKQRPHKLLWMLWFDQKSISNMHTALHYELKHKKTVIIYDGMDAFLIMISNEIMKYYFLYTRFLWLDLNKIA